MRFSKKEIKDLLKSLIVIALVFTFANGGLGQSFLSVFFMSLFTVGIGFTGHELAHKYFAQKYLCWSEFRSNDKLLGMSLIISLLGVVFIAPGAVMIHGNLTKKKHGIVSVAGPAANIFLAILFLLLYMFTGKIGLFATVFYFGFRINVILALFNMLPFLMFDGRKVFLWSKKVYFVTLGLIIFLQGFSMLI